jgi:protein-tyrosine phosphatase
MFFFKKKSAKIASFDWLQTDMHSHLLPGIDDGAQDTETSLQLIRSLTELGYKKLITTPHILWELYPNTTEIITQKLAELKQEVAGAGINIELQAAAEYFMDEHFQEQLEKKLPLLTLHNNLVLVEFSMITAPIDLQKIIFDMQLQGYQPVIAHPERYIYLDRKREVYDLLKNAGCFFQLNLLSITGHYGKLVQELANYLFQKDYYELAGTDLHHAKHISLLQNLSSTPLYSQIKEKKWQNSSL